MIPLARHPIFAATQTETMLPFFNRRIASFFPAATQLDRLRISYEFKYGHNLTIFYKLALRDRLGYAIQGEVIGKSALVESTRVSFDLQRHLWKHGFSHAPTLINRPLAYVPAWNLHLYEAMRGPLFQEQFADRSKPWIKTQHQRVAAWLKKLHSSPLRGSRLKLGHIPNLFRLLFLSLDEAKQTGFKQETRVLATTAQKLQSEFNNHPLRSSQWTITHGDFGQHNIIVFPNAVGVIDFDTATIFDPAFDVASYLTQMRFGKPRLKDGQPWSNRELYFFRKTFLKLYHQGSTIPSDWERRLVLFDRFFLLKIAIHLLTWFSGSRAQKKRILNPIVTELQQPQ